MISRFQTKNLVISLATVGLIIPLLLLLLGMMKDNLSGVIMEEFVGLHSKMQSFKKENNEDGGSKMNLKMYNKIKIQV